ncbi:hypothetical protein C2G38_2243780 [Gigaspora rosea]|uniref:Uncharacterized protein n=1 Tax=Gigaspora rosea TaxID=44941 RepID=A0A397VP42_9GLOM|nr:hypothetical protein C2G38_2243780 [Gigaspora rosea]
MKEDIHQVECCYQNGIGVEKDELEKIKVLPYQILKSDIKSNLNWVVGGLALSHTEKQSIPMATDELLIQQDLLAPKPAFIVPAPCTYNKTQGIPTQLALAHDEGLKALEEFIRELNAT